MIYSHKNCIKLNNLRIINLKLYPDKGTVLSLTLDCLKEIICDRSRIKKVAGLPSIKELISNASVLNILLVEYNDANKKC